MAEAPPINAHPLRERLTAELHARPYHKIGAPTRLSHLATLSGEDGVEGDRRHVAALAERLGAPAPTADATHYLADMGPFTLKWERHTEFSTYTFFRPGPFAHPFDDPVIAMVSSDWLASLPGQALVTTHLAIQESAHPKRTMEQMAALFKGNTVIGCTVAGGKATTFSDLRRHDDGFSRILVHDQGLNERQTGRLVQRLLEINTYRYMALLALPLAQDAMNRLCRSDQELASMARRLAGGTPGGDTAVLDALMTIAAEIEEVIAGTAYRFDAARAYHGIVRKRLEELREERIEGLQTFSEFFGRRLEPAMATCVATAARQDALSQRAARLSALMRTRVEINLKEQNMDLLASMDRRAKLQLRLQETVEGLSVVAISYYALGLTAYAFKALKKAGVPLNTDIATGLAIPIIIAIVWFGLQRMKKHVHGKPGGEG